MQKTKKDKQLVIKLIDPLIVDFFTVLITVTVQHIITFQDGRHIPGHLCIATSSFLFNLQEKIVII